MIPARRYAREIESRWAALLERPVVLGERDWALICDWHARGIPLALIGEAFDQLAEKLKRRRSTPRNLTVLVPWVEDAWRTVRGGRNESAPPTSPTTAPDPLDAWNRCVASLAQDDSLRAWLQGLLARLRAGEPAENCEEALREGLLARIPEGTRAELEDEVGNELEAFRGRMTRQTWEATRERALFSAARRRFGLPVLSGPAPSPQDR